VPGFQLQTSLQPSSAIPSALLPNKHGGPVHSRTRLLINYGNNTLASEPPSAISLLLALGISDQFNRKT